MWVPESLTLLLNYYLFSAASGLSHLSNQRKNRRCHMMAF